MPFNFKLSRLLLVYLIEKQMNFLIYIYYIGYFLDVDLNVKSKDQIVISYYF